MKLPTRRAISELVGVALFSVALILLIALATHSDADIAALKLGNAPHNFAGRIGVILANSSYGAFGYMSFIWPALIAFIGWHVFWCVVPFPSFAKALTFNTSVRVLDAWASLLPSRIADEELGDYIQGATDCLTRGDLFRAYQWVATGLLWTSVNTVEYMATEAQTRREARTANTAVQKLAGRDSAAMSEIISEICAGECSVRVRKQFIDVRSSDGRVHKIPKQRFIDELRTLAAEPVQTGMSPGDFYWLLDTLALTRADLLPQPEMSEIISELCTGECTVRVCDQFIDVRSSIGLVHKIPKPRFIDELRRLAKEPVETGISPGDLWWLLETLSLTYADLQLEPDWVDSLHAGTGDTLSHL